MYMLRALAPPAARLPPTSVARISVPLGIPRAATIMVGTVVTRSSSMIRGLVRARKARSRSAVTRRETLCTRVEITDNWTR